MVVFGGWSIRVKEKVVPASTHKFNTFADGVGEGGHRCQPPRRPLREAAFVQPVVALQVPWPGPEGRGAAAAARDGCGGDPFILVRAVVVVWGGGGA